MDVTLRQLQYFLAVADMGSVKAAAQACHVSPSGISLALSELERSLGAQVTVRSKRNGTSLTLAGELAASHARRVLQDVDELVSSSRRVQGEVVGKLRIGCSMTLSPWILPRILEHFSKNHSAVDIDIIESDAGDLQRRLKEGRLDACFIHLVHAEPDVGITYVAPLQLNVVLPSDHPLAAQSDISLSELADMDAILLDYQPALGIAHSMFKSAGIEPRIRWTSKNAETVRSLVARGLGYTLMMGRPQGDHTYEGLSVIYRPLRDALKGNAVVVATPSGMQETAVIRALLLASRAEFQGDSSPTRK